MDKKDTRIDKVNQVALEWYEAKEKNEQAVVQKTQQNLFVLLYELNIQVKTKENIFISGNDLLGMFFEKRLHLYNPLFGGKEHPFYQYVTACLKFLASDNLKENSGYVKLTDTVSKEKKPVEKISFDSELVENEATSYKMKNPEKVIIDTENYYALIALIVLMPEKLTGRANNEMKKKYYRLFTTDYMTYAIKVDHEKQLLRHERDIIEAMHVPFLDFYLLQSCRSMHEIYYTSLKKYGDIVKGKPMEEITMPLKNDIFIAYLENKEQIVVTDSAISNQHKAYKELLGNLRKCEA